MLRSTPRERFRYADLLPRKTNLLGMPALPRNTPVPVLSRRHPSDQRRSKVPHGPQCTVSAFVHDDGAYGAYRVTYSPAPDETTSQARDARGRPRAQPNLSSQGRCVVRRRAALIQRTTSLPCRNHFAAALQTGR